MYLCFREAIQKLAHPYRAHAIRQGLLRIEEVHCDRADAAFGLVFLDEYRSHGSLTRQVRDSDMDVLIIIETLKRPFAQMSANIQNMLRL